MGFTIVLQKPSVVWADPKSIDNDRLDSEFYKVIYLGYQQKIISSKLTVITIGEALRKMNSPIGWQGIPSSAYLDRGKGIPLLRVQSIQNNEIAWESVIDVESEIYFSQPAIQAQANDIIVTRVGTIGRFCKVPSIVDKIAMGQNLTRISFGSDLDIDYLLAYMNTDYCLKQMERYSYGGVQSSLTNKNLKNILLALPTKQIQQYIGEKLRKAEELRQEAKQLREEAEHIFKNYVGVLNSNKKMIKNINVQILDNDTWAPMFFDSLQITNGSDLDFVALNNVQKSIKCGEPVKKEDRLGQSYPFYGASGISDTIGSYNFDGQYLIIAQDGSIGCVSVANGKFWANNHVWIVEINEEWNPYFLSLYLNRYPYWYCLTTGSVVPKVTSENLRKLLVPVTPIEIQNRIGNRLANAEQRQSLAEKLIQEAKRDVEDLIEGKFDESKISEGV